MLMIKILLIIKSGANIRGVVLLAIAFFKVNEQTCITFYLNNFKLIRGKFIVLAPNWKGQEP